MRLSLRQLQIYTSIADTGSTTAAALRVSLSQSATSGALNELEALLDARLFDRIGKRLVLNDTGRALLPQARALLDLATAIESQFGVGHAGGRVGRAALAARLRVGASTTIGNYLLPPLVAQSMRASPETRIDVVIGNTSEVAASVAKLEVDVGFIEGPCHEPDLEVEPWRDDALVVVCAPRYLSESTAPADRTARRLGVKALRQQHWLLREPGSGTREAVERALLPHLHRWASSMELGSTEAIKQAAAEGLGLACLPLCAVQDLLTLKRLVVVDSTLPRLSRRLYLIHHRQKQFSNSLGAFVEHCRATPAT